MKNWEKMACIAFIAFFTGMTITQVGQTPDHEGEPYSWLLVWSVFVFMAFPAAFGYLAGKKDGQSSNAEAQGRLARDSG